MRPRVVNPLGSLLIMFIMAWATNVGAATLSLEPSTTSLAPGETFTLDINIDDATGVAACAFALVYPEAVFDLMNTPVTTTFFQLFYDNRPGVDIDQIYPFEKNTETTGKIMLAGAYIDSGTGSAGYNGSQTLFTIHFQVKDNAPLCNFQFSLEQTGLFNPDAGWYSDSNGNNIYDPGEDDLVLVPVLTGAVANTHQDWNDVSNAFPVLLGNEANPFNAITEEILPGIQPCTDLDRDGDGVIDELDGCPDDAAKTDPGQCGCGVSDVDSDSDGTMDCNDDCPDDALKILPGVCGCGVSDIDTDSDETPDCNDGCNTDPLKTIPGICGCGVADTDTDSDGTPDCNDGCDTDPFKTAPGHCGCGLPDIDSDGDATFDCNDECPDDPHKVFSGICGCKVSDIDTDNDSTPDCNDIDDDNDGILDIDDTFPLDDTESMDTDEDGIGDNEDTDDDNDGVSDTVESLGPNEGDANNDGMLDSKQSNVASVASYTGQGFVILETPPGINLSNCQSVANPSSSDAPSDMNFDYGFFDFTISGLIPGGSTTLTMTLPSGINPDTYYKYGQTQSVQMDHWYEFLYDTQTGAEINANIITLHFSDALRGDDVLAQDSMVVDLGAPGFQITTVDGDDGDGGGGGGVGCFINTL